MHTVTDFEEHVHGRGVVVLPVLLNDHVVELFVVILSIAQIENQIRLWVLHVQKLCYVVDIVPIHLFNSASWEAHPAHVISNISDVQIVFLVFESLSFTRNNLPEIIH